MKNYILKLEQDQNQEKVKSKKKKKRRLHDVADFKQQQYPTQQLTQQLKDQQLQRAMPVFQKPQQQQQHRQQQNQPITTNTLPSFSSQVRYLLKYYIWTECHSAYATTKL